MSGMRRFLYSCLVVGLLAISAEASAAKPVCGDGECRGNEDPINCPVDCGPPDVCGDAVCDPSESCSSCEIDCGVCPPTECNNDGICNDGEDCLGCADCPGRTSGNPRNRFCCGLDTCDVARCGANACSPVPVCGNGLLEYNEECDDGNLDPGDGCDTFCVIEPISTPVPLNQFNIGDSIGEAEAADGTIGSINHDRVWSTGYAAGDVVDAVNERFESLDAAMEHRFRLPEREQFYVKREYYYVLRQDPERALAVAEMNAELFP
ncbi:MAG: DUF4215 domain-containing protein, partial [Xanthomonadales bacterium]|nr:DUF4215 domain-containing protein [Xanthomonadales bacterium]